MKFLVCQKQPGEGCDYTIGCGMRYDIVEADSKEEVIENIIFPEGRDEYCALEDDNAIDELLVINITNSEIVTEVDLWELKGEVIEEREKEKRDSERQSDEAEFERLRKKLGK